MFAILVQKGNLLKLKVIYSTFLSYKHASSYIKHIKIQRSKLKQLNGTIFTMYIEYVDIVNLVTENISVIWILIIRMWMKTTCGLSATLTENAINHSEINFYNISLCWINFSKRHIWFHTSLFFCDNKFHSYLLCVFICVN